MAFDVKLYFSGSVDHQVSEHLIVNNVHRLFTYAYPKEIYEYLNRADELGIRCRIMVDSGAFTAWNIGKPVALRDLLDYHDKILRQYGARHDFVFIALDVIPGTREGGATDEDIANAEIESMANFATMQQHHNHHKVMPVYHSGEDVRLRNHYLGLCDYLCLSMNQTWSENNRLEWAKRAHVPGVDFHGLAATGNKMVTQIDWFSVDSSSWVTVGSMGNILWPVNGQFRVLPVSGNSPSRHDAGNHIDTLTPVERELVHKRIVEWGFDPEVLAKDYRERWRWNIYQWCFPPWETKLVRPMDLFGA